MNLKKEPFQEEEVWNKKRIILSLIIFLLLFGAIGYYYVQNQDSSKDVKGVEQKNAPVRRSELPEIIQEKIQGIKEDAENIQVSEIATSSPQVQKVINDIKEIQNYPQDQAKSMCEQLCDSL